MITRKDNADIDNIIRILTTMSDKYGSSQTNWNDFQLFNSTKYAKYGNVFNMLFKDSTTELKALSSDKRDATAFLGPDYGENREAMASCTPTDAPPTTTPTSTPTSISTPVSPITGLALPIAVLGAAQRLL